MTTARSVPAADGVPLHVELDGRHEAPVTVVRLHGWSLDRRAWWPVARSLATGASPVRVVRPDHRGHGRSAPVEPATMTIDQLADDLAAVIAATAPNGPLVLAGHSMGGMTLMALAERHPDVVARAGGIALVATASGGLAERPFGLAPPAAAVYRRVERRISATRGWARREQFGDPRVLAPAMRWLLLGARPSAEARRITCEAVAECRPITVSGFQPTLQAHERDAALAAFADIPTVVLVGSRDRLTPVHAARRIARALPSARLTIFPDAGHMLPLERVSDVVSRIAALAATAAAEQPRQSRQRWTA